MAKMIVTTVRILAARARRFTERVHRTVQSFLDEAAAFSALVLAVFIL